MSIEHTQIQLPDNFREEYPVELFAVRRPNEHKRIDAIVIIEDNCAWLEFRVYVGEKLLSTRKALNSAIRDFNAIPLQESTQ